jgi:hypothetical protein
MAELEALKRRSLARPLFAGKELTKRSDESLGEMTSRHHIEAVKQKTLNPDSKTLSMRRQRSHAQPRRLQVFPPLDAEKMRENLPRPQSKVSNINPHPLRLLLPNKTQNVDNMKKCCQMRTRSGQFYQAGTPVKREMFTGRFSTLSSRWKSRPTSMSANARLIGVHDKGGTKLVPKWIPLAFRL